MRAVSEWEGGDCSCGNMGVRTGFVKGLKMKTLIPVSREDDCSGTTAI
jgi:hypothetical protein